MPIRGSDGLIYADLGARLLGEPKRSLRNGNLAFYRWRGYSEESIRAYYEAFDQSIGSYQSPGDLSRAFAEANEAGLTAAYLTGGFCAPHSVQRGRPVRYTSTLHYT